MRFLLAVEAAVAALMLSGCIAYAPSNTNWNKTPKIVLQVCALEPAAKEAEIILYRSGRMQSLGFDFKFRPRGVTTANQGVFETILEGPSPFHEAIGVQAESRDQLELYVFEIPKRYTTDWSPWVAPDAVESTKRREIDRLTYMRGRAPLTPDVLSTAPRLRYRLEYPSDYYSSSRLPERYKNIPECS